MDTVAPATDLSPREKCLLVLFDVPAGPNLDRMRNTDAIGDSRVIKLAQGEAMTLRRPRRGSWLVSERGTIWITEPGDPTDYLLREGEGRWVASRRGIVVSAIGPAELRIVAGRQYSTVYPATVTARADC